MTGKIYNLTVLHYLIFYFRHRNDRNYHISLTLREKATMLSTTSLIPLRRVLSPIRAASSTSTKHPMTWLDLRGLGLSALERLSLEELLLRHDPLNRCWGIVGCRKSEYYVFATSVALLTYR